MHELSLAQGIIEIAQQSIPPDNHGKVRSVTVKVGDLSGVVVDSLTFCFTAISAGTPLEGAFLQVERVPVTADCSACRAHFTVADSSFLCPQCGSGAIVIATGRELSVTELELFDEEG